MSEGELLRLVSFAVALVPSIVLHEVAHGWVANLFGDHTARDAGRLSLNPVRHIDPFGTLLLPGVLIALNAAGIGGGMIFGYAKPVPVNAGKVGERPWRMILVAASGPLVNAVLAVAAALVLRAVAPVPLPVAEIILAWVILNAVLFVFNLLPIPRSTARRWWRGRCPARPARPS